MKTFNISLLLVAAALSFCNNSLTAQQKDPDEIRGLVNKGVELYEGKKYTESGLNFKKGLEKVPDNFQAGFNLGDAQYRMNRYDEAAETFKRSASATTDKLLKAKAYHNMGNSLVKAEKLQEGIDAYKKALRLNPYDNDTKYNLSYALNKLKEQNRQNKDNKQQDKNNQDKNNQNQQNKDQQNKDQQNQDNNQNNKDQNKDQNKQNQNDQNKNGQDKDKQQQNKQDQNKQDQQQNNQDKNNPGNQQQMANEPNRISKDEAERILSALKNNEKQLQKQLRKHSGKRVKTAKDW